MTSPLLNNSVASPLPSLLVVDDDESTLELIKTILEREYRLSFAKSGAECFAILKNSRPDLILLDVILPDQNGFDICRTIRNEVIFQNTPVILVTVKDSDKDVQEGLSAGAADYVKKPIRQLELQARIKTALSKQQLVTALQKSNEENQKLIVELQDALAKVRELSGLLPICSECKSIRKDDGYWQKIEDFVHDNSSIQLSHSLCPNCTQALYANESWFPEPE